MSSFWKGKKVLVTGADGFIGSHLTETLVKRGAQVRAFVLYNSFGNWGWLDESPKDIQDSLEVFPGDIRDMGRVEEAVNGREYVFHLSSLIAIPYSYHAPQSYVDTNVNGAMNVLSACRKREVVRLIHTSTSEVYGTAQFVPISEQHPLQGQSPYSASKIAADMMAESFYRSFKLPLTIVRPFNTYGPRQSLRAVIPTVLSQLHSGVNEIKVGSLTPTRDFNFVSDTVSGFLAAAEEENTIGQTLNLGSGREISVGDLIQLCVKISGKNAKVVQASERLRPENSEVERLLCDYSKMRDATGWTPSVSLEQGLSLTSDWVSRNLHRFKSRQYGI